jgi:hypothetical protein
MCNPWRRERAIGRLVYVEGPRVSSLLSYRLFQANDMDSIFLKTAAVTIISEVGISSLTDARDVKCVRAFIRQICPCVAVIWRSGILRKFSTLQKHGKQDNVPRSPPAATNLCRGADIISTEGQMIHDQTPGLGLLLPHHFRRPEANIVH